MDVFSKLHAELLAWNDKVAKGYELSAIELIYYEGLRKSFSAMFDEISKE